MWSGWRRPGQRLSDFSTTGHGAANSKYGDNYLIPVEAPIASDSQLALQAVKIASTSVKTNFLVFDACRNVPIGFSVRSSMRGLRPEAHRQGVLIAFATDPGKTATDEGVYAQALTEEMQKPGVLATEVFRAVRSRVLAATENRQFPWIEDGLIDNMYFKPPSLAPQAALPGEAPPIKPNEAAALTPWDITVIATLGSRADDKEKAVLGILPWTWPKVMKFSVQGECLGRRFYLKNIGRC